MNKLIMVAICLAAMFAAPASAQGGGGTGGGTGKGGGAGPGAAQGAGDRTGGQAGGCADGLRVFHGDELIWSSDADSFAGRPGVRALAGGHSDGRPAIALSDLLADFDDVRTVEVAACGGRSKTFRAGQVMRGNSVHYVVLNKRGRFKFVTNVNGREQVVTRQVGRITITTRE